MAGIMGGLFLLAQYLGRLSIFSRSVIFAAAIMLALNPFLLRLDVGFHLSFLAMMGIIHLSPILIKRFKKVPLKEILIMTLSAYLFTLPILIYNFSYFSLVAPIVNILVVLLLSFVMILGFIFVILGLAFQSLGWILSFPI